MVCFGTSAEGEDVERGDELVALKTGMGSSAALVTSLVAALVAFFVPSIKIEEQRKDLELVHNLAQLSHCYVQRKVQATAILVLQSGRVTTKFWSCATDRKWF